MTHKERLQRIRLLKQQLTLTQKYKKEFEDEIGKKGRELLVDSILDELYLLIKKSDKN